MTLLLVLVKTGDVLDRIQVDGDDVTFESGKARALVTSQIRRSGSGAGEAANALNGWSNGYLAVSEQTGDRRAREIVGLSGEGDDMGDDGVVVTAAAAGRADVVAVLSALRARLDGDVRDELDQIIADLQTLSAGFEVDFDTHLPGGHNQADHGRRRTGVLGSVLDRLENLRGKLSGQDLNDLDSAMNMLRGLESSGVDDDDLEEPEDVEDDDNTSMAAGVGTIEVIRDDRNGQVDVQWDDGSFTVSIEEGAEIPAMFNRLNAIPYTKVDTLPPANAPDTPKPADFTDQKGYTDAINAYWKRWSDEHPVNPVGEATTSNGMVKAVKMDDGQIILGDPDEVDPLIEAWNEPDEAGDFEFGDVLQLSDDEFDDFAALMATAAGGGPTTAGSMFDADVSQMPAQLQAYWLTGEGAAKVRWCTEGSFRRARRLMLAEGVPARMVNGTVANLYRKACGKNPGRHTSLDAGLEQWHVVENSAACAGRFAVSNADGTVDGCFDSRGDAFTHIQDLYGLQAAYGPPTRDSDCPPSKHRMPDGTCMDDDLMHSAAPPGALWHAVVHTEGISTGKRTWLPQSVEWRPPPFALHQEVASSAHGGQPVTVYVGNTLAVARTGNAIHLWGDIDLDSQQGQEWARKLMAGYGGWPSFGPGSEAIEYDLIHGPTPGQEPQQIVFRKYRMGEVTAVSVPGQEGTYFEALPALVDALGARTAPTEAAPIVVAGGGTHTVEIPNLPPSDWFEEPEAFPHGYAVVMEDNGHIYGLVAPDGEAHRTYHQAGERRTLSSLGKIDLTRYMRETIVDGGQRVYAGPLTMECMHAPTQGYGRLDRRNQFYQDTCSVFARVAVGMCSDGAGMWLNGAAMPGVTSDQVLKFLACGVSLDVQPHPEKRGWLELVAVLVVPSEGWAKSKQGLVSPVTRIRETEDGGVLVASVVPTVFDGPPVSPRVDSSIVFGIAADAGVTVETRIAADAAKVTKMLAGR